MSHAGEKLYWAGMTVAVVAFRLLTRLHYVADPDSLRFALGLKEFDLVALQPHFPGYPIFIFLAKSFSFAGAGTSVSFALVGALATLILLYAFLKLVNVRGSSPEGLLAGLLVLVTPMISLMGVRYMPDLLGTGVALLAVVCFVRNDYQTERILLMGFLLTGLLAGIRLSYLPLVILPAVIALVRMKRPTLGVATLLASTAVWLIPMISITGWDGIIAAATAQTTGHFVDFGGTVGIIPDLEIRRLSFMKGIVADGFGGYWEGRHFITLISLIGVALLFARGVWKLLSRDVNGLLVIVVSMLLYSAWVLLYQNIVYQPRHLLPLVPLLLAPIWLGARTMLLGSTLQRLATSLFLLLFCTVSLFLSLQQQEPTAIAQVAERLRGEEDASRIIYSTPLINWYLETTGVTGTFLDARELETERADYVVGWFVPEIERREYTVMNLFHNPYVNSIWPEIPLYRRGRTVGF